MSRQSAWLLTAIVASGIVIGAQLVIAQEGPLAPPPTAAPQARVDVVAAAPDDVTTEALGHLYDERFRPLVGAGSSIPSGQLVTVPRGTTQRILQMIESATELQANARAWGIEAQLRAQTGRQHAYYRAVEIERIVQLSDTVPIPAVPATARYYLSAVYMGRLFEARFSGAQQAFGGGLSLSGVVGSGSIASWATGRQLQFEFRTIGFEPTSDDALFARTDAEMRQRYRATGETRAILARYSRLPTSSLPTIATTPTGQRRFRVALTRVRFPDRNGGSAWDFGGGAPEIMARISQGRRVLLNVRGRQNSVLYEPSPPRPIAESVVVSAGAPLTVTLWDEDVSSHDSAGVISITSLTTTAVAEMPPDGEERTFSAPQTGAQVTLRIEDER